MRSHVLISIAVGALLATATPCLAQNPAFYYADPSPTYTNQLQSFSSVMYFPRGRAPIQNQQRSGIGTAGAGSSVAGNDAYVVYSLSGTNSIGPYKQNRMSQSGIGGIAFSNRGDLTPNQGITNQFNVLRNGGLVAQEYYGLVSSDVHPAGTTCNLSGSISMTWGHNGSGTVTTRGSTLAVFKISGMTRSQVALYRVVGGAVAAVHTEATGQLPTDQNINGYTGSPPTLSFATTAVVGDYIEVQSNFTQGNDQFGPPGQVESGVDSQSFTVIADVN